MVPEDIGNAWKFELYIIGDNRRSTLAMENLRSICKTHLKGRCTVDVFDVKEHPELMAEKSICVAPTLIKKYPLPEKILVGDMSFADKVLDGLDIHSPDPKPGQKNASGNRPEKTYRDGLKKQGLNFKHHHIRH